MKNSLVSILIHGSVWTLLFVIPFISTFQVVSSFAASSPNFTILPVIVLNFSFIGIFYFNYYILIPKFIYNKKYLLYAIAFIFTIALAFGLSRLIFYFFNINPDTISEINPVLPKLTPIIQANGFLLLVIAILASVLLSLNNRYRILEKEKLSAEISTLKMQINPHFLFNTLNNIYASAIDTSPQTADMIDKLSAIMRYTMKDTQKEFVALRSELNFIDNYIVLQKLRFDENIKIEYNVSGDFDKYEIVPMLLIPFIENSFKHGVNSEQECNLKISIEIQNSDLYLNTTNDKVIIQNDTREHSGLGIENTQLRLQLSYPNKHTLKIIDTEKYFIVSLHINLT